MNLLDHFQDYDIYSLTYNGQLISLNKFYSGGDWRVRNGIVKKYHPIFKDLIKTKDIPRMEEFGLLIEYNSRHDPDNITGTEKLFMDAVKEMGIVEDDSKKYYKLYSVYPNLSLKTNTIIFNLVKFK